ncbi:MAG: chlorophyll synthase ChlG [Hyphomicrobium sp.]|nr:chlorophyll synthase ChlG [Hyphomicrobium sp.]
MASPALTVSRPEAAAVLQLLKPITWFPPMWAFGCGLVSSGAAAHEIGWMVLIAGILLTGPLVCGTSQVVNDWYDQDVDRINEPQRPIPSGRVPGQWGLYIAYVWTVLSLAVSTVLGPWGLAATALGLILAWAYSAPPVRFKQNGWYGNAACASAYEGLPWFTGALVATGALPDWRILILAALYSAGAHGIMTLNDFKSIEGDRQMGIRSIPVQLGPERAAIFACIVMAVPQIIVVALLFQWGASWIAGLVLALIVVQLACMKRLISDPKALAPWYNATGVTLYVLGMLASAFAVRSILGVAS